MKKTERPQTAKNSHPLQKYRDVNKKHVEMKKTVQEPNFIDKDHGFFNKVLHKNNVAIRIQQQLNNNDEKFPAIFGSALLKMSGEPTITYGIDKKTIPNANNNNTANYNNQQIIQFSNGVYFGVGVSFHNNQYFNENDPNLQKHEEVIYMDNATCGDCLSFWNSRKATEEEDACFRVLSCFSTADPCTIMKTKVLYDNWVDFNKLNNESLKTIARHFCKIFLFQMHDRKLNNLLVLNKQTKDNKGNKQNKHVFVECDFDDLRYVGGDFMDTFFGNCNGSAAYRYLTNGKLDHEYYVGSEKLSSLWQKRLDALATLQYPSFIKKMEDARKLDEWNKILEDTVKEYTMDKEKITKIIQEVAKNSKYMNISRDELIAKISAKLQQFKTMCQTPLKNDKGEDILAKIPGINEARKETLEALNKFCKNEKIDVENIGKIVDFELAKQDFGVGLETKKYCKEDGNIKKTPLEKQLWQELKEDVVNKSYNYPYRYVFFQDKNTKKEKFVNKKDEYNNIICKTKNGTIKTYDINGDLLYTQEIVEGHLKLKHPTISATETKQPQKNNHLSK